MWYNDLPVVTEPTRLTLNLEVTGFDQSRCPAESKNGQASHPLLAVTHSQAP